MLTTAKPALQATLQQAIGGDDMAKVFEKAYLLTLPMEDLDEMEDQAAKEQCRQQIQDTAQQFGQMCAAGLNKVLTPKLVDAIEAYVKSIGIVITPTALACAVGPVTGAIAMQDVQII